MLSGRGYSHIISSVAYQIICTGDEIRHYMLFRSLYYNKVKLKTSILKIIRNFDLYVLRLIFGFNSWESVRNLREAAGYKSLTDFFAKAKKKFELSLNSHRN